MKADYERAARFGEIAGDKATVKREVDAGHDVAVVVSAMSGKTNELVAWTDGAGVRWITVAWAGGRRTTHCLTVR